MGPLILTVCGLALLLCGVAVTLGLVHVLGYFTSHNTHLKFAEQKRVLDEEKRQAVEQMNEAHKKQSREQESEIENLRREILEQKLISARKLAAKQRDLEEVAWEGQEHRERLRVALRSHTRGREEKTRKACAELEDECARVKSEYEKSVNDLTHNHTQQLEEKERQLTELSMIITQSDLRKWELEQQVADLSAQQQLRQSSSMPGLKAALKTSKTMKRIIWFHAGKNINMRQSEAKSIRRMLEAKYRWKLELMKRRFRREVEVEFARRRNDRPDGNEPKPRRDDDDDNHDDGRNGKKIALPGSGPVQDNPPVQQAENSSDDHQLGNVNPSTENEGPADDEHLAVDNHPIVEVEQTEAEQTAAEQTAAEQTRAEQTESDQAASEKEKNMTVPIAFRLESRQSFTSTRSKTPKSRSMTPKSLPLESENDPQSSSTDSVTDDMLTDLLSPLQITPVTPAPVPNTVSPTVPAPNPVIAPISILPSHNLASPPAVGSSQSSNNASTVAQDGDVDMGLEKEQASLGSADTAIESSQMLARPSENGSLQSSADVSTVSRDGDVDMGAKNEQATLGPATTAIVPPQRLESTPTIGSLPSPVNVSPVAPGTDVVMIDDNEQAAPGSNISDGQDKDKDESIIPDDEMTDMPTVSTVDLGPAVLPTYTLSAPAARPLTAPQSVYTPSVISPFSRPTSNDEGSLRRGVNRPLYSPSSSPAWTTVVHRPRSAGHLGAPYAGALYHVAGSSPLTQAHPAASTLSPSALPSTQRNNPWAGMRELRFRPSQSALPAPRPAANMLNKTPVLSPLGMLTDLPPYASPTNTDITPRSQQTPALGAVGSGIASGDPMTHAPSNAPSGTTPPAKGPSASVSARGVENGGGVQITPTIAITASAQPSSSASAQNAAAAPSGNATAMSKPPAIQAAPPTPSNQATRTLSGGPGPGNLRPRRPLTEAEQKEKDDWLLFGVKPKRRKTANQSAAPRAAREVKNQPAAPEAAQEAKDEAAALEDAQVRTLMQKLGTDSAAPKKPSNLIVTDERHHLAMMYGTAVKPRSASSSKVTTSKRGRSEDPDESRSKRQRD